MTDSCSVLTVPFCHSSGHTFPQLVLLAFLACSLGVASPSISVRVSSETTPPGGYAQLKIFAAPPALISAASIALNLDPTIFGPISSINAFSATGDQIGSVQRAVNAQTGAESQPIYVTSASASLGQLPDLPIFIVNVPVLATAKIGVTSSITVDPTTFPWKDQNQNSYTVTVNPGTFTVGGTLSIQSVTPGAGLLPTGAIIAIDGTGFDATTTATIDGVTIASTKLVSPQQLNLTLGGSTEMAGKHVHLSNAAGASTDFFASLSAQGLILPSLPALPYTAVSWNYSQGGAMFTAYDCMLNSNAFPVTATYYDAEYEGPVMTESVVIPPYGFYIGPPGDLPLGLGALYMTLSAPIRMTTLNVVFESLTGPNPVGAYPPAQMTSLGQFTLSGGGNSTYSWNWQIGTPAPQPQTAPLISSFPFTIALSGGAADWLKVTPTTSAGEGYLTFQPVVTNLGAGSYTGTVVVTQQLPRGLAQFGPSTAIFNVVITASAQPTIVFGNNDDNADFNANPGGPAPAPISISIDSNGTPAAYTTSMTGGSWLTVTPSSGTTPATLTLTANPTGLAPGNYSIDLLVQGPINTEDIPVSLSVAGTSTIPLQVAPSSLSFILTAGQGPPASAQAISLLSNMTPTVTVTTQSGGNWLLASLLPHLVQVNATAANLGPGTYQGQITIITAANGQSATVPVTLTVYPSGPSQFSVSPSSITMNATAGGPSSTATITVIPTSGSPLFTYSLTDPIQITQNSAPPPTANQFVGPATITIATNASLPGNYQATFTITWAGGSATIPITINVAASPTAPPSMSAIVSSGSAIPGSIAPGELISIFGAGLGTAPTTLQLTASGNVATTLNGTQVLINDTPAPLIYSSSGQVNAIVPFAVANDVNGAVFVQVTANGLPTAVWTLPIAPSTPSVFTLSASGVGNGAIVNQDGSVNSPSSPAAPGSAIQIYATGGGAASVSTTGAVAQSAAQLTLPVTVSIGGVNAQVLYAGNAPGEVEGVVQINVVVPQGLTPGAALPVLVTIGGAASQSGVTIAIQ
jgi:uncharacterized protein (TIGR03437 family)